MQHGTSLPCRKGKMVGPSESSQNSENQIEEISWRGISD
jgi:hypothetical protein